MNYPVLEVLPELKEKLNTAGVAILQAPPGAGKSTVVPTELLSEPWLQSKKIIMLEPRRLAARSVAMRMADLAGESVGKTVGYRVRFESRVSSETRIEVVTEGILTRMIQTNNELSGVGLVIFDEFHERSLQADLALALTLQVRNILRPELRILIMSATLDEESLSSTLNAPLILSEGRRHPVTITYLGNDDSTPIVNRVVQATRRALRETAGDILVFLPGAGEIQRTEAMLEQEYPHLSIHALYGDLSFAKQQEAIRPHPANIRKVVLATSIAETSLTIEGIGIVIDSGLARVPRFDPRSGLTRLDTVRVTRDSADQRAGRAGRLGPGMAYRLWSEGLHNNLVRHRSPEILEADLAQLVLELRVWGTRDISELTWITPPPQGAIDQAKELLMELGALDDQGVRPRGKEMAALPTHPRIAHMLLEGSADPLTASLATDIAGVLEERDPLPRELGADLTLRVKLLRQWRRGDLVNADHRVLERIERLASAWRKLLRLDVDNGPVSDHQIGTLVMQAYPERIARQVEKHSERYKLKNGRVAKLPPHDPLVTEAWIAVANLDAGAGEGKIFTAAPVNEEDLSDHAVVSKNIFWDDGRGMVAGQHEQRIGSLLLSSRNLPAVSDEEAIAVICRMIREQGLSVLGWMEKLVEWQDRVMSLRAWRPQEGWPDVSDQMLVSTIEDWLPPFLTGIRKRSELQRLAANAILPSLVPWPLSQQLDSLAPTHLKVPSGSSIKVHYFPDGKQPVMEVRLQEVFGLHETPLVNDGKTKITMHLLSPGFKPVQVTQDLRSFWSSTYAEVRKELRTRYPKHSWPEDPWTAVAVRGVKRK